MSKGGLSVFAFTVVILMVVFFILVGIYYLGLEVRLRFCESVNGEDRLLIDKVGTLGLRDSLGDISGRGYTCEAIFNYVGD